MRQNRKSNRELCSICQQENGRRPAEKEKACGNQVLTNGRKMGNLCGLTVFGESEDERLQNKKWATGSPPRKRQKAMAGNGIKVQTSHAGRSARNSQRNDSVMLCPLE